MSTEVQISISEKLQVLLKTVSELQAALSSSNCEDSSDLTAADKEAFKVMPIALGQYKDLLESLQDEWKKLMETDTDLGTVTSYAGNVFNPQEIPLVQIVHCIICDVEMLLSEANASLSSSPISYSDLIDKVYAVVASLQFLCHTNKSNKDRIFPSKAIDIKIKKVTDVLPGYYNRLQITEIE